MIDLINRLRVHRSRGAALRENKEPREVRVDGMKSDVVRHIGVITLNADEQQEETTRKLHTIVSQNARSKWTVPTSNSFSGDESAMSNRLVIIDIFA